MSEGKQQAHCITIMIVGALNVPFDGNQLTDLMQRTEQAITEVFPDFLPANPPVTVITSELRDDWIKTAPREGASEP